MSFITNRTSIQYAAFVALVLLTGISRGAPAHPQELSSDSLDRRTVDETFATSLDAIAEWCNENGQPALEAKTRELKIVRDPGRLTIFLPTEFAADEVIEEPATREWHERVQSARNACAQSLLDLARQKAETGQGGEAYRLLHECLHWAPDLSVARQALGHLQTEKGWQPYSERLRVRPANRPHPITKWKAGDYLLVTSDDFEIASNADEATTIHLAEQLQRWQWVWRQVFFDYWSNSKNVVRWLDGKSPPSRSSKKFSVFFFQSQDAYVKTMSPLIPGIEISTGYYSDDYKASFFYASSDVGNEATWRHELTHQLFKESISGVPSPFKQNYLWLGEGIALYMESLQDHGGWVTLGGFDSPKLQYARVRKLREGFHVPVAELNAMSAESLQRHSDVRRIYSQMTGLTHFLMHAESGKHREALITTLEMIYRGKIKPDKLEAALGISFAEIDRQYGDFLQVPPEIISRYLLRPQDVTQLSLPGSRLDDDAFQAIGKCHDLIWLDISGSAWNQQRAEWLKNCQKLDQLYLTGSPIEPGSLAALKNFPELISLDLSGVKIESADWTELGDLTNLVELSVAHSSIGEGQVATLLNLKNLRSLNVSGTQLSAANIQTLQKSNPALVLINSGK